MCSKELCVGKKYITSPASGRAHEFFGSMFDPSTPEAGSITAEMAAPVLKFCLETDCSILQGANCSNISNTESDAMFCVMP